MSDGMSEGHRWAEESDARQRRIDAFFAAIERLAQKQMLLSDIEPLFNDFDALRFQNHLIPHVLKRTRKERWRACSEILKRVVAGHGRSWIEILVLSLQHASPCVTERLQGLAGLEAIVLCASNGEYAEPKVYGDLSAVIEALEKGFQPITATINDPYRAIVGVQIPNGKIISDTSRETLRFLGAYDPALAKT